jgi:methionyl-tRNA formyltransferase
MFWQLPASVRLLAAPARRRYSVTARHAREPLDILFCGSDAFSIRSLDAICEAKREVPGLIRSIEVVHRKAKRTGRGMKMLTEGKHSIPTIHPSSHGF